MGDAAKGAIDVVTDTVQVVIDAVFDRVEAGPGWRTIGSIGMRATRAVASATPLSAASRG